MYKTTILIPFRDRDTHLKYFVEHTVPILNEYLPNTKVVVIEQADTKLFNRGALLNIGFKECENKTEYFITHDVDMNPSHEVIRDIYSQEGRDVIRIRSAHKRSLGGVAKFKHNVIFDINGFPNNIWGWGIEDRALFYKCYIKQIPVFDDGKNKSFRILPHKSNENMNYVGDKKIISDMWTQPYIDCLDNQMKIEMITSSGINNLEYTVIDRQTIRENVELIKVVF